MDSEALVQLALETLLCSQKELAHRLGVSPTQISKWKKGEHMSMDMEDKIRGLTNIGRKVPSFVVWAGSIGAAAKWEKLIQHLGEIAEVSEETGYDTPPLTEDLDLLCGLTVDTLTNMGVDSPKAFPNELDNWESHDDTWALLDVNPYTSLISKIYKSFTNVYGFYAAYVNELVLDEELELWDPVGANIDGCLLDLAASKLDVEDVNGLATNFQEFRYRVTEDYKEWLNVVKGSAFRAGVPLRTELLSMVYRSDEELGEEADLGDDRSRLHPDIYMDELLRGMRMIHQVLPAILKKLGIDDVKIDPSQLRVK